CPVDTDGDGVADYLDKCPGTPAGATVDADGCELDTDGDGVADYLDKCPGTPSGATVDAVGCVLDTDGDGVADYLDKCPGTPAGIPVDVTGCPQIIKKGEKIILDVKFATDSDVIKEESFEILEGVATTMLEFADIKIAIRGFTDNVASDEYNLDLSSRRANSVMSFLTGEGVAADRMTAKGFGEDPQYFIADNDTDEGRAQNRRVELESVE
ncbi:MAG: OmpA family protein, partial [bacterium]|nr:OmpA family protein [bacterium]